MDRNVSMLLEKIKAVAEQTRAGAVRAADRAGKRYQLLAAQRAYIRAQRAALARPVVNRHMVTPSVGRVPAHFQRGKRLG